MKANPSPHWLLLVLVAGLALALPSALRADDRFPIVGEGQPLACDDHDEEDHDEEDHDEEDHDEEDHHDDDERREHREDDRGDHRKQETHKDAKASRTDQELMDVLMGIKGSQLNSGERVLIEGKDYVIITKTSQNGEEGQRDIGETRERLEHMHAALEHLERAGLDEVAEHLRKRIRQTERRLEERERALQERRRDRRAHEKDGREHDEHREDRDHRSHDEDEDHERRGRDREEHHDERDHRGHEGGDELHERVGELEERVGDLQKTLEETREIIGRLLRERERR